MRIYLSEFHIDPKYKRHGGYSNAVDLIKALRESGCEIIHFEIWEGYEQINDAIESSDAVLAIVDEYWLSSTWMAHEASYSIHIPKIVPVFVYKIPSDLESWFPKTYMMDLVYILPSNVADAVKCLSDKMNELNVIAIRYESVHTYIPIKFPELNSKYLGEIQENTDGENILNYVLFPFIFHDYVNGLLRENMDMAMLNRVFEFYEEMAVEGDMKVKTLLQVGLLECLWDDKTVYENSLQYMRSETRKLFENVGQYLRVPK